MPPDPPAPASASRGAVIAAFLIAPLLAGALCWLWQPAVVDDAFITFRYARNWAGGHGITFNPGAPAVEGYTNFLWMALAAGGMRAGWDPIALMPLLGALAVMGTCLVLTRTMQQMAPRASPLVWALPGFLVAADPLITLWGVSGLETPLAMLCITGLVCSAAARAGQAHWTWAPWLLAASLTRPDAILWGLALGLWGLRVDARRAITHFAIPFAIVFGAYWLWRWRHFESFWPNTFHAKGGAHGTLILMGMRDLGQGLAIHLLLLLVAVAGLGLAKRHHSPHRSALTAISAAVGLHFAHLIWIGGDAFPGFRFLIPAVPAVALVAALGIWGDRRRPHPALAPLLILTVAVIPLPLALNAQRMTRTAQWRFTCVGQWIDAHMPPGSRVALNPIGAVGYHASEAFVIDMLGLTDAVIGRGPVREPWHPPGHRKGSGDRVLELAPDLVLINNVWLQPQRMLGWTPLYASESDLHGIRQRLLGDYEMRSFPVPRADWPQSLPEPAELESIDQLWLGMLIRRGRSPL